MPSTSEQSLSGLIADTQAALDTAGETLGLLFERINLLEKTLGISSDAIIAGPLRRSTQKRTSVGRAHLVAVLDYIKKYEQVRQADIARDLKLNSGTVSVATGVLSDAGNIEAVDKIRGSIIWSFLTDEGLPAVEANGAGKPRKREPAKAGGRRRK